jgi:type I restriction enzyme S subunit
VTLGEAGALFGGLTGKSKADFQAGGARYVSYMNVFANIATDVAPDDRVSVGEGERQRRLERGDILFTGSSETPDECGMSSVLTLDPPDPLYLNSFCIGYRLHDREMLDPEFAKHLFRSASMRYQIVRTANGVTRFNVSKRRLAKITVPVPDADEQRRIAGILDKFDSLVNDLSVGLPAELKARRRQYEYYRDRLLTFEEAA